MHTITNKHMGKITYRNTQVKNKFCTKYSIMKEYGTRKLIIKY